MKKNLFTTIFWVLIIALTPRCAQAQTIVDLLPLNGLNLFLNYDGNPPGAPVGYAVTYNASTQTINYAYPGTESGYGYAGWDFRDGNLLDLSAFSAITVQLTASDLADATSIEFSIRYAGMASDTKFTRDGVSNGALSITMTLDPSAKNAVEYIYIKSSKAGNLKIDKLTGVKLKYDDINEALPLDGDGLNYFSNSNEVSYAPATKTVTYNYSGNSNYWGYAGWYFGSTDLSAFSAITLHVSDLGYGLSSSQIEFTIGYAGQGSVHYDNNVNTNFGYITIPLNSDYKNAVEYIYIKSQNEGSIVIDKITATKDGELDLSFDDMNAAWPSGNRCYYDSGTSSIHFGGGTAYGDFNTIGWATGDGGYNYGGYDYFELEFAEPCEEALQLWVNYNPDGNYMSVPVSVSAGATSISIDFEKGTGSKGDYSSANIRSILLSAQANTDLKVLRAYVGKKTPLVINKDDVIEMSQSKYDANHYNDIIIQSDGTNTGQLDLQGGSLTVNGVVKFVRPFTAKVWYAVGFPFKVASVNVIYEDADYQMETYNADGVATKNSGDYWLKKYDDDTKMFIYYNDSKASATIEAGGYVLQVPSGLNGLPITFSSENNITLLPAGTPPFSELTSDSYVLTSNPSFMNLDVTNSASYNHYTFIPNNFGLSNSRTVKPFESLVVVKDVTSALRSSLSIDEVTASPALDLPADKVVATEYYNLMGVKVAQPAGGNIYVIKTVFESGKTSVVKQLIKN